MAENSSFRVALADAINYFTDEQGKVKRVLFLGDVIKYTGRDRKWCRNAFGLYGRDYIDIFNFAQIFSRSKA